jgi:hypothetical protein
MATAQLAMNTEATSPGLFFKDSTGALVKVGPVHVGTTAPNATPASGGQTGNSLGEQWLDTSGSTLVFKVWDGTAWRSEAGEFVNVTGDTMTGALVMDNQQQVQFRETTANGTNYIALQAPASVASDKTITLPDVNGTVVTTGDTGTVTSTMIANGTIVNADINASAAIAGTKISPDFGSQTVTTTGVISAALGSASTPSITFTGDLNTGIYSPGADQVAVATGGTGRLFVDSSGRVGLGTSSPGRNLTVQNSSTIVAAALVSNPANISYLLFGDTDSDAQGRVQYDNANDSLQLYSNATERVRIDSSGRVGIGTQTPQDTIDCLGRIRVTQSGNNPRFGSIEATADEFQLKAFGGAAGQTAAMCFYTGNNSPTEKARLTSDGKFLVGTSSASANGTLFLQGTNAGSTLGGTIRMAAGTTSPANGAELGIIAFSDSSHSQAAFMLAKRDGGTWTSGSSMPSRLEFSTTADGASSPTERMRIHANGTVSIASTNTSGSFSDSTHRTYYSPADQSWWHTITTGAANWYVHRSAGNPGNFFFFGVGNTNTGSITTTTTSTSYNTSSDYRLKENVVPLTGAIDRVNQLQVHRFNFIADPERTVDGFIAHEAQTVIPEAVTGEKDAVDDDGNPVYQGIDQSKLVPLLTAALQEALQKIDAMEARLAALEGA